MIGVGDTASHCAGFPQRTSKGLAGPLPKTLPRHTATSDRAPSLIFEISRALGSFA